MSVKRCKRSQCTKEIKNSTLETAVSYLMSIKVLPHLSLTVRVEHLDVYLKQCNRLGSFLFFSFRIAKRSNRHV